MSTGEEEVYGRCGECVSCLEKAMSAEIRGTGIYQGISRHVDRIPAYDPRTGEHYWTFVLVHHVDPDHLHHVDVENLVNTGGPGCWYCGRVYEPRLKHRRCPGPSTGG